MSSPALSRLRELVRKSSFVRFLISGGLNTALTYVAYLFLLQVANYTTAFTAAYLLGIVIAFTINRSFVFQTHRGWRSIALFPLVYLAQYLTSIAVIWLSIREIHLPAQIAPLIAIATSIPVTFVLSQLVFGKNNRQKMSQEKGSAP